MASVTSPNAPAAFSKPKATKRTTSVAPGVTTRIKPAATANHAAAPKIMPNTDVTKVDIAGG
jgi:hypothetical protein